jgi:hypothetical protein
MRADTKSVTIQTPPSKVVEFLADPRNLPRWAVGFAKAVEQTDGRWLVTTGSGKVGIRIEAEPQSGVVDFVVAPAPGVEAISASRVLPNGSGSEYIFTQFQAAGMPDDVFEKNVTALAHELTVLRALLEIECPL